MGDMPTRQKILMIVLACVVAFYLYTMIGGSDEPATPQPIAAGDLAQNPAANQQATTQSVADIRRSETRQAQRTPVTAAAERPEQSAVISDVGLEWKSDPFFREKTVAAVSETPETNLLQDLKWGGSSITAKAKFTLINGKIYKENDTINGFKIVEIYNDHIILTDNNNKRYTLR
ncbi:MAG: hypothetical protein GY863_03500 [bacterium]|nr:hypothetical protein [bacterium]